MQIKGVDQNWRGFLLLTKLLLTKKTVTSKEKVSQTAIANWLLTVFVFETTKTLINYQWLLMSNAQ